MSILAVIFFLLFGRNSHLITRECHWVSMEKINLPTGWTVLEKQTEEKTGVGIVIKNSSGETLYYDAKTGMATDGIDRTFKKICN